MSRKELLIQLNMLFPGFSNHIEEVGLAQINKSFCMLLTEGLHQQSEILKNKAERMEDANKFRYEQMCRIDELWRKLQLIYAVIQNIDYDVIEDVQVTDAMLERTYNQFSAMKWNADKIVYLLRKLSKAENIEDLCDEIEKAADALEQTAKM